MTETLPSPPPDDEGLKTQIVRSQTKLKAYRFIGEKIMKHRTEDYQPNVPRFAGQVDAYQDCIVKIQIHIDGIKKMHMESALTEDEYRVALKWTNEVLGIPANLVEIARGNMHRAEGAVHACNQQLESINEALRDEQANIRRLEAVGERVDDLAQRKAEAAASKAKTQDPKPVDETPLVTSPLQTA